MDKEEAYNVLVDALNDPKQAGRHAQIRAVLKKQGRETEPAFVDQTGEGLGNMSRLEMDSEGNTRDVPARRGHEEGHTIETLKPQPAAPASGADRPDDLHDLIPGGRLSRVSQLPKKQQPVASPPEARPGYFTSMGREYPDDDSFVSSAARTVNRVRAPLEKGAMVLNRAIDVGTGGLYSKALSGYSSALGTQIGPSEGDFERFQTENPTLNNITTFAANVNPKGIAAKTAGAAQRITDPLFKAIQNRVTSAGPRIAAKGLQGAAVGGGGSAATAGLEALARGEPLDVAASEAGAAGKTGMKFGGALGTAFGGAGEAAAKLRNRSPDLQALHKAGLEPSPIPGKPVVRQDKSLMSQIGDEAPLVPKATPATRGAAARDAADEIVTDVTARKKANNQRFGELRQQAYAKEGNNQVPINHIISDIDNHLQDLSLSTAARGGLENLRAALVNNSTPAGGQTLLTAKQLDQLRDFADGMVRKGEISKADVQFIQVADNMRNTLAAPNAGPTIAALNKQQSEIMKGFGKRKAKLGMKKDQRGEGEDVYEAVARRLRESGEETATAGVRTPKGRSNAEHAAELGAPPVLPGTRNLPPDVDYRSLINVPRLQLAQENMQATPSKVFSGAGQPTTGMGLVNRYTNLIPNRLIYPLARRAGDRQVGSAPFAFDELTRAVRQRGENKKKRKQNEGAEQ
jgi:hypothetical protein